ncbi:YciI family protein [Nocardia uniformis]|nr:YciI family protein [Nocardia uniformis]
MKYMLIKTYSPTAYGDTPIGEWSAEDIQAHIDFQRALGEELTAAGELVDARGLAGPEQAHVVCSDGRSAPMVTDGPFPATKEFLAGFYIIDVESLDRALEIAAQASAAPGPGGKPLGEYIEVRAIMSAPAADQ